MSVKEVKLYNAKVFYCFFVFVFLVGVIVVLNPLSFSAVSYNVLVFSYTFLLQDEFVSLCLLFWGYHLHEWHSNVPSLKNTKYKPWIKYSVNPWYLYKQSSRVVRPAALLKKRLWHRCFPANFVKFLRTPFFAEHLWWLLLYLLIWIEELLCRVSYNLYLIRL